MKKCKIAEEHEYECGSNQCCFYCESFDKCEDSGKCDCYDSEAEFYEINQCDKMFE